jgi:class 3 adenylate cyclase/tetratricopeptide (TPR) repeat protein
MALGRTLPESTRGTALFADISGFTPLTEALTRALGLRRGAEALPRYLNQVYDALIAEVDRYGGSVIGFAGDAITCWFADDELQDLILQAGRAEVGPLRAAACALATQQSMQQFAAVPVPGQTPVPLAVKVALASGPARRFLVGDPKIQLISTLAGETLARMAAAEHLAGRGEVVADGQTAEALGRRARIAEWREAGEGRFAVVGELRGDVEPIPWPALGPDALDEAQVHPWLLPQVYARLEAGLGEFLTELRPAVAVFLRFSGIDFDADEQAGAKLDAYVRWVQTTAARCEGTLIDITIGDKGSYLYVAFGAPIAHEDDPLRAVTTAHELRTPPVELDFVREVRIGVSQGTMRTGAYGGTTRRTYGVLGDETNFAARLMQHAAPGEVLISPRVQQIVGDAFQWEILSPIKVKGKTDLVTPARLVGPRGTEARAAWWRRGPGTAPVGREGELARLESVLEQLLAGRGQILRLEGGRGMGKGRLALTFARKAAGRGVRVCVGPCQSTTRHILYAPWRPIFRDLLALDGGGRPPDPDAAAAGQVARLEAAVDAIEPEWRIRLPLLGDLLGLPIPDNATTATLDPRLRQEALLTFAVELVQAQARARPLLLLLLDAHWMDETSQALVMALGRVAARAPLLLMPVHRSALPGAPDFLPQLDWVEGYHHLALGPLAPEAVATLVAARLDEAGDGVSPLALSIIQARAQGTPYFAEVLVEALREGGHLARHDGVWELSAGLVQTLRQANCLEVDPASGAWRLCPDAPLSAVSLDIPDSVHGIVLSRVDRLPEAHKATLKVASVVGRVFELGVLGAAHPARPDPADLQAQQAALEQRDFVRTEVPGAVYAFASNVLQEVVYEMLPGTQQRELHGAVGAALEAQQADAVERLAYHYGRAPDKSRDRAMFYLDKAAHKVQREYANETALNYYNQALALEERWTWRKGQTEALHILGRRDEEKAALRILASLPDAPACDVAYLWGQYYEAVSDYARAEAVAERALGAAGRHGDRLSVCQIQCLSQLGLIARRQGDYDGAREWYGRALAPFRSNTPYSLEETDAYAQALNGLGIVHRQQGSYAEARACYERSLALARQAGNRKREADALCGLGATTYYQRRFAEEVAYYEEAVRIQRTIGDRGGEVTSLISLAQVHILVGRYTAAEEALLAALTAEQALGSRWEESNVYNALGVLYLELGDLERAEECLQKGLELCREIGDEAGEAYMLCNLGLIARDRGDFASAEELLDRGLFLAQEQDDRNLISVFLSYMSTVSLAAGRLDQAIDEAMDALAMRRKLGLELLAADDLALLAAAHQRCQPPQEGKALNYARQSLAILDGCSAEGPEFPARDYFLCYQVLAANGQTAVAQAALASARCLVEARAEKIDDPARLRSFLENVPDNHQILAEIQRGGKAS